MASSHRPRPAASLTAAILLLTVFSLFAVSSDAFTPSATSCAVHHVSRAWTVEQQLSTQAQSDSRAARGSATKVEQPPSNKEPSVPSNLASLLDDALCYDLQNSSSTLVTDLTSLRQSSNPLAAEDFLDAILAVVDTNKKSKLPLGTGFSRRSRLASMSRVLDLSTPSAEEENSSDTEEEVAVAAGRRRRRALAVLLRTLAKENESGGSGSGGRGKLGIGRRPTIRSIEKAAIKDAKQESLFDDMSSRLPSGLETPKYDVVVRRPPSQGGYEIREYDAFTVCTVSMKSNFKANDEKRKNTDQKVSMPQLSGASSFGALAGYLFGKNSEQTTMKMTTPVLTTNAGVDADIVGEDGTPKEMSFVLPSTYWSEDGTERAPQPLDGSGVRLQREDGGKRAALMFGGFASRADVEAKKSKLLAALEEDGEYMIEEGTTPTLAQYNDPFTPPWKRLNEVSVPVVPRETANR